MVKSLIDPKKKAEVRDALKRGDFAGILGADKTFEKPAAAGGKPAEDIPGKTKKELNALLFENIRMDNLGEAKRLLKKGADVNARHEEVGEDDPWVEGTTPLMAAAEKQNLLMVGMLLRLGADPMLVDNDGANALALAVPSTAILRLLINAGADVNNRDRFGDSALDKAMGLGEDAAIDLLRAHGAK